MEFTEHGAFKNSKRHFECNWQPGPQRRA